MLLFFLLRLWNITQPPLEIGHNWRQVSGLMVAHNFHEDSLHILYPKVDDAGATSGLVSMEFPLLNWLHAVFAELFGFEDWYGRLINLVVTSLGVLAFQRIIRRFYGERTALFSMLILLVSIWFAFARKTMPDTFSAALVLMGMWQLIRYLDTGKLPGLLSGSVLLMLGVLSKLPAALLLVPLPLFYLLFDRRRVLTVWISTLMVLLPALWWYFSWAPGLAAESGIWFHQGQSLSESFSELTRHFGTVLKRFYFDAFSGFVFFGVMLFGLWQAVRMREKSLILLLSITALAGAVFILRAGFYFHHHSYYIIPFVPLMALVAGYGLHRIPMPRLAVIVLVAGCIESVANQQHDFFTKDSERYKLSLTALAAEHLDEGDLIAINGNGNPQQLWFTRHKGWVIDDADVTDAQKLKTLHEAGADWLVVNKRQQPLRAAIGTLVKETEDYSIFRLKGEE